MKKTSKWIIVKNATKSTWPFNFPKDPVGGVTADYSEHTTDKGKEAGIAPSYTSVDAAILDCEKINKLDPAGKYAVCPLDYGKISVKH